MSRRTRRLAWTGALATAGWWLAHRTSPAVRRWRPGTGERGRAGPLAVRTAGAGTPVVLLLHGLVASGEVFGAGFDPLATDGRLVVPDLLGFGGSMDMARERFDLDVQLEALDAMAQALGLGEVPLVVGAHSMGALVGLHWAARHATRVQRVVTWGAPLYRDPAEAERHVRGLGPWARLLALEGPIARRACAWMCAHRDAASWLAVAAYPRLPVALARQGVLHTWPAYRDAMSGVILHGGWAEPLRRLDEAGVPVVLAAGRRDPVPVPGRAGELARAHRRIRVAEHPDAAHDLPLADPGWCVSLLRAAEPGW